MKYLNEIEQEQEQEQLEHAVPATKKDWLKQLTLAVKASEKSSDWVKSLALDSLLFYDDVESFKEDGWRIKRALATGLSEQEREAYDWDKKNILDSKRRKDVLDKVGKYYKRMLAYAWPTIKEAETAKAETAKAETAKAETAKAETAKAETVSVFGTKDGLMTALNAVIIGINASENTDYNRETVIASLQQIIRTLV